MPVSGDWMSTGRMAWGIGHKRGHGCGRRTALKDILRGSWYRTKIVWDGKIFFPQCLSIYSFSTTFHVSRESRVFILASSFLLRPENVLLGLCVLGVSRAHLERLYNHNAVPGNGWKAFWCQDWTLGCSMYCLLLIPNSLDGLGVGSFKVYSQNMAYLWL